MDLDSENELKLKCARGKVRVRGKAGTCRERAKETKELQGNKRKNKEFKEIMKSVKEIVKVGQG